MDTNLKDAFAASKTIRCANPASHAALASFAILRQFRRGDHVFRDRDEIETVFFLVKGIVSLYKLNSLGEKRVIFTPMGGQMLNESIVDALPASISCEALEDCVLLCFDRRKFLYAMEQDFELTKAVVRALSCMVRRLYRQVKNASGSVRGDKRLAAKLWKLARDRGAPCERGTRIEMKLSVTYLAEMLGAKRESVSRHLKTLMERNLVERVGNVLYVPDRERLAEYFKEP